MTQRKYDSTKYYNKPMFEQPDVTFEDNSNLTPEERYKYDFVMTAFIISFSAICAMAVVCGCVVVVVALMEG